jgi:hypothetical protein
MAVIAVSGSMKSPTEPPFPQKNLYFQWFDATIGRPSPGIISADNSHENSEGSAMRTANLRKPWPLHGRRRVAMLYRMCWNVNNFDVKIANKESLSKDDAPMRSERRTDAMGDPAAGPAWLSCRPRVSTR